MVQGPPLTGRSHQHSVGPTHSHFWPVTLGVQLEEQGPRAEIPQVCSWRPVPRARPLGAAVSPQRPSGSSTFPGWTLGTAAKMA